MTLIENFEKFCKSSATNVEIMDDDLRHEVNVKTKLDEIIAVAIKNKRSVVLTGTAGSGKTHLIETIGSPEGYQICRDLADSMEKCGQFLKPNTPCIVAGNEGALIKAAKSGHEGFQKAVEYLHRIQKGEDVSEENMVVIDVAGFDPVGSHTIDQILQLPIIEQYINQSQDWRQEAWICLKSQKVRARICRLLETVSAESEGYTFRQLWQMIADIVVNGKNEESTWYFRLIEGESQISNDIKKCLKISELALTHIGNKMWHGDLLGNMDLFVPESHEILKRLVDNLSDDEQMRRQQFKQLRTLAYFAMEEEEDLFGNETHWQEICKGKVDTVLSLINKYLTYGFLSLGSTDLYLWFEHASERREDKQDAIFATGKVPSSEFEIRRSRCVANALEKQVYGGRKLLIHKPTNATLLLTKELITGIGQTRAYKNKDRKSVEYDWRICHFLAQVSKDSVQKERLLMAKFEFENRLGAITEWEIEESSVSRIGA
jgi:hypothetical protein